MIHIAYITTEYPHLAFPPAGGIGSFIKLMASSLVENGCEVTVFLCLSNRDKVWYDNKIRIIEIKEVTPSRLASIKDRVHIGKRVNQHIKKDNIDIVEAPDWEGMHAFCNVKIPLITRIHGSVTYFNYLQGLKKPRLLYHLEKRAIKKSQHVIAVSDFSGELTKEVFSLEDCNFETIYNGIDINAFKPIVKGSIKNQSILYFGTLVRKKGVVALAHIFNELHAIHPETTLTLVGKDTIDLVENVSTWELMKTILTSAALEQVDYKGVIPYQEMAEEISQCAVCVFPSFAEAFPISWLEAMAMEKPIVASSIGWANESIQDEQSGLLEHPENYKDFAKKIDSLLTDNSVAEKLGRNARVRVRTVFDQGTLVKQNINMYKRILNNE